MSLSSGATASEVIGAGAAIEEIGDPERAS
jgi:hypothetical protein